MIKQELRKIYLDKRKNLSPTACAQDSRQLFNLFFSYFDLSFVKVLHTYLPIEKNHEPDTWIMVDRIRREFPHIRISIPKVSAEDTLENFYFEGLHQLKPNLWGIQEPRQGVPTPIEKIDLVIVPLLIMDSIGHRVGYGKGYYDRFLKTCRSDCKKIGLSFFEAIERIDDADSRDVRLNASITPGGVINFNDSL